MRILKFNESKKEKDVQDVIFDIKSLEKTDDDLIGFVSDFEEVKDSEIKKIKKEIQNDGETPGLKRAIKKFEEFSDEFISDNISENIKYHFDKSLSVIENIFRPGSDEFFNLLIEGRKLFEANKFIFSKFDKELFEKTDIGKFGYFRGQLVPLDLPMEIIEELNEAEYKGRDVKLNKPMRSTGPKKYKVYVKNPKTDRVMCVNFGDVKGGLKSKSSNAKSRKSFAARHKCHLKKDKTTAGYWSCRLNRYKNLVKSGGGKYW
jgi:hypothetical protein